MQEEERKKFFVMNPARVESALRSQEFLFRCDPYSAKIFSYPRDYKISNTKEYIEGKILSMSLWSIIAIDHLEINENSKILDMCCAPGMKLVYAGLLMQASAPAGKQIYGTITGIDISRSRLSITKSLIQKYKVPNVRLLLGDSASFISTPVYPVSKEEVKSEIHPCRCKMEAEGATGSAFYTSTSLRRIGHNHKEAKYDRIIVDPECSQTSTVKYAEGQTPKPKNYAKEQLEILSHGINMLAVDGILIYSTCTFEEEENEGVIQMALKNNPHITRIPIEKQTLSKYGVSTKNIKTEETVKLPFSDSLFIAKLKYGKQITN
ncbi:hypothetical protein NERG_00724 [Nematocida ausubeli]|uniref:SAM-dependent MTase RsmB/NOP-type domain-containing protein n=1 Tax=Nematocida ausubeli (strain ATCC PRA-371 / ERTm2) TaxID=1913371 RepID=H8ZAX5_NEMA1|nr:hypothetical protein NERG_00724 [Nematocida ausubeli]